MNLKQTPRQIQAGTSDDKPATFTQGIRDSLPIVIGYLPIAFAFGLSAVKLGFTPLESVFFSCVIYAGASQFVITALLSAGVSLWFSALTVMAMDVRHVLYGPALQNRISAKTSNYKTALWAFGLTDEVFAAATAKLLTDQRRWSEDWMLGISLVSWLSWVIGTAAGALIGHGRLEDYPVIEASLTFMLPALFLTFLLASFRQHHRLVVVVALCGSLLALFLFSIPVAIFAGIAGGCITTLFTRIEQGKNDE